MTNQSFAIIGGTALIALGLYFGLRERAPAPQATATESSATVVLPQRGASATPAARADTTSVALKAAIEKRRSTLVDTCWKPRAAKQPEPRSAKLSFNGTIGTNGRLTAYGISEHREAFRAGLSECVQRELGTLQLPAPPRPVEVNLDFELP